MRNQSGKYGKAKDLNIIDKSTCLGKGRIWIFAETVPIGNTGHGNTITGKSSTKQKSLESGNLSAWTFTIRRAVPQINKMLTQDRPTTIGAAVWKE